MTAGRKPVTDDKVWLTPPHLASVARTALDGTISLDPCAHPASPVAAVRSVTLPDDGLAVNWPDHPTVFCNPPYGRDTAHGTSIADWLAACAAAAAHGSEVVALVPVATNTRFWQRHVYPSVTLICLLHDPRVRFWKPDPAAPAGRSEIVRGAPMACCLLYWGEHPRRFTAACREVGTVVQPVR